MAKGYDRACMTVTAGGTGAITLGAAVAKYQTFAAAGAANGDLVSYVIEDGTNWEMGDGTYTSAGTTLTRTTVIAGSSGTSPINVTTSAIVYITQRAADVVATSAQSLTTTQQAQAIANIGALSAADPLLAQLLMMASDALSVGEFVGSTGNRFADTFAALTYVNTGGATNLDSSVAGKLRPTISVGSDVTASGNAIASGTGPEQPPSTVFDNIDDNAHSWGSPETGGAVSGASYIGQDFGAGVTKDIIQVAMHQGWSTGADNYYCISSVLVQYSDNGSTWSTSYTWALSQSYAAGLQVSPQFASVGAHRYWRFLANSATGGGSYWIVREAEMRPNAGTNALTVAATGLSAAAAPSLMRGLLSVNYIDTPTLNTDLMMDVSRDGGTTWTTATLTALYAIGSVRVLQTNDVSVSGQPSGTSPRWRVWTANNKMVELLNVYLYWS